MAASDWLLCTDITDILAECTINLFVLLKWVMSGLNKWKGG